MNNQIEDKINEINNYIMNTSYYKNYLKAKEIISKREDLNLLIDKIKQEQKDIIKNPSKKLKEELNNNIKILESDITYIEYKNNLIEINNMLAIIENKLNKYFYDVFN